MTLPEFVFSTSDTRLLILPIGTIPGPVAHPVPRDTSPVPARNLSFKARTSGDHAVVAGILLTVEGWEQFSRNEVSTIVPDR